MPKLGLHAAAELTGRSRSTIHRAMEAGRISYERDESGNRMVDTAELLRVFGERDKGNHAGNGERHPMHGVELRANLELERAKNALLQERLADKDAVIDDLRRRLDAEAEERRRLTMLLTDQRPPPQPAERRGWWRGWRGK